MAQRVALCGSAPVRRTLGRTRYGGCFHGIFARVSRRFEKTGFMKWLSLEAVASVAYKEFLHIYRDRRVLLLVLTLPPLFTLLFGYAFESGEITGVSSLLINRDNMPRTQEFIDIISKNKTFQWRRGSPDIKNESDLLGHGVQAALVIPAGWNESLENGDPKPLVLYIDGADINMVEAVEGSVRESLGDFQLKQRDRMIETLPEEVFDLGKQLPLQIRKRFVSMMEMWTVDHKLLYNPKLRVIDYVVPGIIGLILQLLTVTLMACTIARERESGTLYQLMVTSLRRREIVIGKILPYLAISSLLVAMVLAVAAWHFEVRIYQPGALALICFLFLLCSLGLGLLISAI